VALKNYSFHIELQDPSTLVITGKNRVSEGLPHTLATITMEVEYISLCPFTGRCFALIIIANNHRNTCNRLVSAGIPLALLSGEAMA
jgi:hypothetical protein